MEPEAFCNISHYRLLWSSHRGERDSVSASWHDLHRKIICTLSSWNEKWFFFLVTVTDIDSFCFKESQALHTNTFYMLCWREDIVWWRPLNKLIKVSLFNDRIVLSSIFARACFLPHTFFFFFFLFMSRYCLSQIKKAPHNESAWNYLKG